jgi:hypothetical protein
MDTRSRLATPCEPMGNAFRTGASLKSLNRGMALLCLVACIGCGDDDSEADDKGTRDAEDAGTQPDDESEADKDSSSDGAAGADVTTDFELPPARSAPELSPVTQQPTPKRDRQRLTALFRN